MAQILYMRVTAVTLDTLQNTIAVPQGYIMIYCYFQITNLVNFTTVAAASGIVSIRPDFYYNGIAYDGKYMYACLTFCVIHYWSSLSSE